MGDPDWRLIREEPRSGAMQMALDEVAARTAGTGGPRTVRVYRWEPSTFSLGYSQSTETVDWAFCEQSGIDVIRRPTGGGGIYHDTYGDISYSITLPAEETAGELLGSYHELLEPVILAFERMGIPASLAEEAKPAIHEPCCYLRGLEPAHDLVVNGRKISGNAQYRTRDAVVQHGSLTYQRTPEEHVSVFAEPSVQSRQFDERVTAIADETTIDRETAVSTLETALAEWSAAEPATWTPAELEQAQTRVDEKFGTEEWTRQV